VLSIPRDTSNPRHFPRQTQQEVRKDVRAVGSKGFGGSFKKPGKSSAWACFTAVSLQDLSGSSVVVWGLEAATDLHTFHYTYSHSTCETTYSNVCKHPPIHPYPKVSVMMPTNPSNPAIPFSPLSCPP